MPVTFLEKKTLHATFLDTIRDFLHKDQIVESGDEYHLLAKDPAVNARKPLAFVFPESREQVQRLVREAAKQGVKLWVYSTGKNWGYLNTTATGDSIVVILNRMNRIIHVDEELAYAIIEPGVTYETLSRHLEDHGYSLWTDAPGGPPSGSVLGNALDRGVGVTRYADHCAHLCGMEVVHADGSIMRTGAARSQGVKGAAHLYKWGVGPYIEGLFSQSNFGVVVEAGIWLMRKPDDYCLFNLSLRDDSALARCMDTTRELMLAGVLHEVGRFSNDVAMLTLVTQAMEEGLSPQESIETDKLAALKGKYGIPGWTASFGIYGQPEVVQISANVAKRRFKNSRSCSRINLFSRKRASRVRSMIKLASRIKQTSLLKAIDFVTRKCFGTSLAVAKLFPGLIDLHEGKPVETVVRRGYFRYKKKRPDQDIHVGRDDIGLLWSVPVLPFKGQEVVEFTKACRLLFEKYKFDFYMTIMIFNARSVCPLMVILYDRKDGEEGLRAESLYREILCLSHRMGYQHFRAGINGWDQLYQSCPELKSFNQRLKKALDPSGVFAPGRYGIE